MKKSIRNSILRTSFGFIIVILYCIISLIQNFSYIDLVYLVVVIGYFTVFLKYVRDL